MSLMAKKHDFLCEPKRDLSVRRPLSMVALSSSFLAIRNVQKTFNTNSIDCFKFLTSARIFI